MPQQRNTSELAAFLQDTLRSEQMYQQQLQDLRGSVSRQLQETERRQREELQRRIQQDAFLSTFTRPRDQRQTGGQTKGAVKSDLIKRDVDVRTSAQTSDAHKLKQPERSSSSPVWMSSKNLDRCSVRISRTAQLEQEAKAECQKQFCAPPVPDHVSVPRYQKIMELREKERKQGLEQRKNFLLSQQKPFSFHQREKEKREELVAMLNRVSEDQKVQTVTKRRRPQKPVKDPAGSELKDSVDQDTRLKAEETRRRTTTAQRQSHTESDTSSKHRTAERTKKELLGFLDEKPSFQPKILQRVPDFNKLHKSFQTAAPRKSAERKDRTKCQPFFLRTSALPSRRRGISPEPAQEPKVSHHLSRSRSLGALTSLSADTLPVYITDAVRQRRAAIRKSMELRENKEQENADWMRKREMRSQAMKKNIAVHAKLLDPSRSLKQQYAEKLQHHREADQRKSRDYRKELRDMNARVSERPYLFEQVKQRSAKAQAEQMYRNKLKDAGLNEGFVEANGEADDGDATASSRSDADASDRSAERDAPSIEQREENADDEEEN